MIGVGQTTFITTQPLLLDDNLPDFVGAGDQITLSPVVYNKTGKPSDVLFTISGTNMTTPIPSYKIHLASGGQETLSIPVYILQHTKQVDQQQVMIEMHVEEVHK